MPSFDYMADETIRPDSGNWQEQLALARKSVTNNDQLTEKRREYIQGHAIQSPMKEKGEHSVLETRQFISSFDLNTSKHDKQDALGGFPRYSARLLLEFKLTSPLLTRDDEPFYLIDNPVRKDHIFGSPYLSAAGLKGLAADAYQRAFPMSYDLAENEANRTDHYRQQDASARRLFGLADDGAEYAPGCQKHQAGRLHFSPAWFQKIQFLVINKRNPETGTGEKPIQMEAIAPDQSTILEVVYFNPLGTVESSEAIVRQDLARWLAAVAHWWPALGLGAKRLAGYGQIQIEKVTLQTVGWSGMANSSAVQSKPTASKPLPMAAKLPPAHYEKFLDAQEQLIDEAALEKLLQHMTQDLDEKIQQLDNEYRDSQGKAKSKVFKMLEKAKNSKASQIQQMQNSYAKALAYWQTEGCKQVKQNQSAPELETPQWPIDEKVETGIGSWLGLAEWIAGGIDGR